MQKNNINKSFTGVWISHCEPNIGMLNQALADY